jgi:hypothetical protein
MSTHSASVTALLALVGGLGRLSFATDAEYAIRWSPAEGGPKTVDETLAVLGDRAKDGSDTYTIQYFEVRKPPSDAPGGAKLILRQRVRGAKYELTFKYRSTEPVVAPRCVPPKAGHPKEEVDVSLLGTDNPPCEGCPGTITKRIYSFSCDVASKAGPVLPPSELEAKLMPCASR